MLGIIIFVSFLFGGSIFCFYMYQDMRELKMEISELNELKQSIIKQEKAAVDNVKDVPLDTMEQNTQIIGNSNGLDIEYTLDFIENEVARYREFVEQQQQFLVWLLGIIATGAVSLLAFLGFKSKDDIVELFETQYREEIISISKKEIENAVGGFEEVKYLQSSVQREKTAKNKKILFLHNKQELETDTLYKDYDAAYKILEQQKYVIKKDSIEKDDGRIEDWTKEFDIIVYLSDREVNRKQAEEENLEKPIKELENKREKLRESIECLEDEDEKKEKQSELTKIAKEIEEKRNNTYLKNLKADIKKINDNEEEIYNKLAEEMSEKNKYFIVLISGNKANYNFEKVNSMYASYANTGMTLLERVYHLLYDMQ